MQRADKRKYHYIYKTTNILNNKFYIGLHSTDDLEDGYVGSGTYLWRSIDKYGRENHVTEILEHLPSRASLKLRETQIVNEELLGNVLCMNLQLGGGDGWEYVHKTGSHKKGQIKAAEVYKERLKTDPEFRQKLSDNFSKTVKRLHTEGKIRYDNFTSKSHTNETKNKMRESHLGKHEGEKNSQFGTCWIHSLEEKRSIRINKYESESYISLGWLKGRKLKF